jgi:hypothetical protein
LCPVTTAAGLSAVSWSRAAIHSARLSVVLAPTYMAVGDVAGDDQAPVRHMQRSGVPSVGVSGFNHDEGESLEHRRNTRAACVSRAAATAVLSGHTTVAALAWLSGRTSRAVTNAPQEPAALQLNRIEPNAAVAHDPVALVKGPGRKCGAVVGQWPVSESMVRRRVTRPEAASVVPLHMQCIGNGGCLRWQRRR